MTGIVPEREEPFVDKPFYRTKLALPYRPSVDCGVLPSPQTSGTKFSGAEALAVLLLLCVVSTLIGTRFSRSLQGTDFPDFYCAARMVAEGQGHQLYNADAQRQYQARYAARVGTLYIHPPFEAPLYLAVAWLPLPRAYWLWTFLNLTFLALAARQLTGALPWNWPVLFALSITFVPVLLCCIQGQDSLLLLSLIVLGFTSLRRGNAFAAGCWLGFGLFKFQLILPIALVLILTQSKPARSSLVKGFVLIAIALALLSAALCGWSVFLAYPEFLLHLRQQAFAGVVPQAMANFRGLMFLLFHQNQSHLFLAALFIGSVAAFVKTIAHWNRPCELQTESRLDAFDLAFASTILFAVLVSYHLNPHDLSLCLLPIFLIFRRQPTRPASAAQWISLALLGILFLPPLHLWALNLGAYALVAIPILTLFLISSSTRRQSTTARN